VSLAVVLIAGARHRPTLLAAGAVLLAGCLPVMGFSPAAFQVFSTPADHYLYLSMLGPAIALAWLLFKHHSASLRVAVVAVLLALIGLSVRQDAYWHDDFTLFLHNVEVNPNSGVSYINLGQAFERAHDTHRAIESFADAARAQPEYPPAWENLAAAFYQDGHAEEAIAAVKRAIDLQVKYPDFRLNWPRDNDMLGRLLFDTGRFAEAIPYIKTASDLEPNNADLARELQSARHQAATHALTPSTNSSSPAISPGR
jgi:tetratricopeptide (TPR) repeat protein